MWSIRYAIRVVELIGITRSDLSNVNREIIQLSLEII